jgi:hypothetical protein
MVHLVVAEVAWRRKSRGWRWNAAKCTDVVFAPHTSLSEERTNKFFILVSRGLNWAGNEKAVEVFLARVCRWKLFRGCKRLGNAAVA